VRRETEEGLKAFREARKESGGNGGGEDGDDGDEAGLVEEGWAVSAGRKRRREKEGLVKGVKRRATSTGKADGKVKRSVSADEGKGKGADSEGTDQKGREEVKADPKPAKPVAAAAPPVPAKKAKGGLVEYGSSDDEDE
jgi:hypothetical protein